MTTALATNLQLLARSLSAPWTPITLCRFGLGRTVVNWTRHLSVRSARSTLGVEMAEDINTGAARSINRSLATAADSGQSNRQRYEADDADKFNRFYKELSSNLTLRTIDNFEVTAAIERFKIVLDYNVPFGKKNRGLTVVASYRTLASAEDLQCEENLTRAMAVGWCVELFQAFFLVADDIMDASITRRGQPCWYRKDKVGMSAINDASYIESCIFRTLKQYVHDQPYYIDVVELFHETIYQTIVGQSMDMLTAPLGERDISRFTQDRYDAIVKWKTGFYSFYLPVALAMYMTGINDEKSHAVAKKILLVMGNYFQVQDDYLDCFGDVDLTGKQGTDIQDNKCTWLVVQALQRANQQQKQVLQDNYGFQDEDKVAEVKRVYEELQLKDLFLKFEEDSSTTISELIENIDCSLNKQVFIDFMAKIYKRKK